MSGHGPDAPRGVRRRTENGQVSLLIIGFVAVLVLAVALVVNVSAAHLQRQGLDSLADGAALHGADRGVSGARLTGRAGGRLGVDASLAAAAVQEYLVATGAFETYPGLRHEVEVDAGGAVAVRLRAPLELPLRIPGAPQQTVVGATARAGVTVVE